MEPKKIKIRTGANLSSILQSTVNIPQAFTELVKNSIQNVATYIKIYLNEDNCVILDDGIGFDDLVDDSGMTGFEKYFVFGNSYAQDGSGIRLGHMGIGGKISNDKLSLSKDPSWTIETKNKHGRCYIINYEPGTDTEFLDDYEPEIREISIEECSIDTATGTKVTINRLDSQIQDNGWPRGNVMNGLKHFFGALVMNLEKEEKPLSIYVDDEPLDFNFKLPGLQLGEQIVHFKYYIAGEEKTGKFSTNLALVNDKLKKSCPLDGVDIISHVKVCQFTLNDSSIINEAMSDISQLVGKKIKLPGDVLSLMGDMRGFINCEELSTVLDDTGMPAKDLSHHGLRDDHPVTKPFLKAAYRTIIDTLRAYYTLQIEERKSKVNRLTFIISKLVTRVCDVSDDILANDEDVNYTDVNQNMKDRFEEEGIPENALGRVRGAAYGNVQLGDRERKEWWQDGRSNDDLTDQIYKLLPTQFKSKGTGMFKKESELETQKPLNLNTTPPPVNPNTGNVYGENTKKMKEWKETQVPEQEEEIEVEEINEELINKHISFDILSFGEGKEYDASDISIDDGFKVLINKDNIRYKIYEKEPQPLLLLLYISETIVKELNIHQNPDITKREMDAHTSAFYDKAYPVIRKDILDM
jgi:hypothetical protein